MDFLRKGGNISIGIFLAKKIHENSKLDMTTKQAGTENETKSDAKNEIKKSKNESSAGADSLLSLAVRVIAAAASHESYVTASISFSKNEIESKNNTTTSTSASNDGSKEFEKMKINTDVSSSGTSEKNVPGNVPLSLLTPDGKFQFDFLCSLLGSSDNNTQQAALSLIMRILKALPLSTTAFVLPTDDSSTEEKCKVLLELLSPENEKENEKEKKKEAVKMIPLIPFLSEHSARMFLKGLLCALNTKNVPNDALQNIPKDKDKENVPELHTSALDAISAFVSQSADYYGKIIPESTDVRLESLEYRKARQQKARMLISRSKSHAGWALEEGASVMLIIHTRTRAYTYINTHTLTHSHTHALTSPYHRLTFSFAHIFSLPTSLLFVHFLHLFLLILFFVLPRLHSLLPSISFLLLCDILCPLLNTLSSLHPTLPTRTIPHSTSFCETV